MLGSGGGDGRLLRALATVVFAVQEVSIAILLQGRLDATQFEFGAAVMGIV